MRTPTVGSHSCVCAVVAGDIVADPHQRLCNIRIDIAVGEHGLRMEPGGRPISTAPAPLAVSRDGEAVPVAGLVE